MTVCVFCELLNDKYAPPMMKQWPHGVAFEPLNPVTPGHVLVVPTRHVSDALEDPKLTGILMRYAAGLAKRPCNLITSAGAAASQTVFHLHIHVVPRSRGDGLRLPWPQGGEK